jgi:hypothetical protein
MRITCLELDGGFLDADGDVVLGGPFDSPDASTEYGEALLRASAHSYEAEAAKSLSLADPRSAPAA